jgi:hypothetical protein
MADYDITRNKGSISFEDFQRKWQIYKDNVKRTMLNVYYPTYWYDKLKAIGLLWYLKKESDSSYTMYQLWDYIYNTFYDNWLPATTLGKLSIIRDYLNYETIFFEKDTESVKKIFVELQSEIKNPKFQQFSNVINAIYFK